MNSNHVQRFTLAQRLVHWVVGLSFTLLLLTGFAFSYPSLFWLTVLVGGGSINIGSICISSVCSVL